MCARKANELTLDSDPFLHDSDNNTHIFKFPVLRDASNHNGSCKVIASMMVKAKVVGLRKIVSIVDVVGSKEGVKVPLMLVAV